MSPKQSGVGLGAGAENVLWLFRVRRRGRAITQPTKRTVAFEKSLQRDRSRGSAVVVEYKRTTSVKLISQGLFCLDRLDDHRGEFRLLVQERLGPTAMRRGWNPPRFIFVLATFSPYDRRAVRQIGWRVELVQYNWFGDALLALATLPAQSLSDIGHRRFPPR